MDRDQSQRSSADAANTDFLAGGGFMASLIAAKNWSETPLGAMADWPQSLKTALSVVLPSPVPMALHWGPDGILIYNDGYAAVAGRRHPGMLGMRLLEAWPEVAEWHAQILDRVLAGEVLSWRDQRLMLRRTGQPEACWFDLGYSPVAGEGGRVEGVLAVMVDRTIRVVGERRLRLLHALSAGTIGLGSVEEVCRAAISSLAQGTGDFAGAGAYLFDSGAERARLVAAFGAGEGRDDPELERQLDAIRDGQIGTGQPGGETAGGATVVLPVRSGPRAIGAIAFAPDPALPSDDSFGEFARLLAQQISQAATAALAVEVERRRGEKIAELDRAKTRFFTAVSHEFRTPLSLILGPIEELRGRLRSRPEDRALVELVERNARRLLKLVTSLLDLTRIEAGSIAARFAPIDLSRMTADLASTFRSPCELAGLRLVVTCEVLTEPVYLDAEMWETALLNLLSNAFKFTREGEIAVVVRNRGGGVEVLVRDTGIGIPEAERPLIFDRFHRVAGAEGRSAEGTGIGLALVREIVELHGGAVSVAGAAGGGTVFSIRLPYGRAHLPQDRVVADRGGVAPSERAGVFAEEAARWLPAAAPEPVAANLDAAPGAAPRPVVVVADDTPDMRDYLRHLLQPLYHVEAVGDGEAALDVARARRPDLVISDVLMPRLDGMALLAAIRGDPALADLPVILLSARCGEAERAAGLQAGADDYLAKPFVAAELLARVQSSIELAALRRQSLDRMKSVLREMDHRVKNTMATVQSISAQSLRGAPQADEIGRKIQGRLSALARSQELLGREGEDAADLREVVDKALEPFERESAGQISARGPAVRIPGRAALALSMALHELATNATQYGALSTEDGEVRAEWSREGDRLRLRWDESGGPPVKAPSSRGFGSRLIERGLAQELGSTARLMFEPGGLSCRIEVPLHTAEIGSVLGGR